MGMNISVAGDFGEVKQALRRLLSKEKCEIASSFIDTCDILVAHGAGNSYNANPRAVVVNSDDKSALGSAVNAEMMVTYGFNSRACVTASSVTDDCMQVCVQRSLPCINGGVLEQQEFSLPLVNGEDPETALAAVTAALVSGLLPNDISKQ